LRGIARNETSSRRGTCFALLRPEEHEEPPGDPGGQEGTMIWIFAVIVAMGFALVKVRRTRKTREAGAR
jgi:hypothetical protein